MLKLSSQQYAGVVGSLQSAAASGGSDKRRFTRMEIQAPVTVAAMTDSQVTRCLIALSRDVSLSGIGLCQTAKFAPREKFLVSLPCDKEQIVLVCLPMFCRPLAEGIYAIGAQFESVADPAKSQQFWTLAATVLKTAS